jgi:hypothetical protein
MKDRAGVGRPCRGSGYVPGRVKSRCLMPDRALGFSHAPAFPLRRLLIISRSLHVADQTLLLTQLLETPNHLLDGLTGSHLDSEHSVPLKNGFSSKHTLPRDVYIFVMKRKPMKLTGGEPVFKRKNCRRGYLVDFRLPGRMVWSLWDLAGRTPPRHRGMLEKGRKRG